ncbi:hypothetical protein WMY93_027507 [Mugilogobius chulae]|uniref:C-type lectin domain-containing protein n=1 Tax=Mugilogobius chulae TaxID=88201 RepID=A0AAW0MZW8_9GOBI
MELHVLLIVASSALAAASSSRQFHFVYELKTQEEARSYCRQHYTDLATVESLEDVLTLNNMVDMSRLINPDGFYYRAWIGLYDDVNSWSWSLSDPDYYSEGQENYRNWLGGEPGNQAINECCGIMDKSGFWGDVRCTTLFPAVCVDLTGPAETLVLTTSALTWEEAQQYCRQHHTDLASVRGAAQNAQLQALVGSNPWVWIGLRRQPWKWLNGNNLTFSFWKDEQYLKAAGPELLKVDWAEDDNGKVLNKIISPTNKKPEETCTELTRSAPPPHHHSTCLSNRLGLGHKKATPTPRPRPVALAAASSSRQFHFVYELKTQEEARSYCRQHYTDLATVESLEDALTLNNMVDMSRLQNPDGYPNRWSHPGNSQMSQQSVLAFTLAQLPLVFILSPQRFHQYKLAAELKDEKRTWIGLYDDVNSWSWSLSDPAYYSEVQESYWNWASSEPGNQGANQFCVRMESNGLWKDDHCTNHYTAICVDLTGPSESLVHTTATFTWEEAQQYCRMHHTDLASVRDAAQNAQLQALISSGPVWIGLKRQPWRWLDGTNLTFSYWKTGEPANNQKYEYCVMANFYAAGKWEDWLCDRKRPFICYNPHVKHRIRLQMKTSAANAEEQVLDKLKQVLEKSNANATINLSWAKDGNGNAFNKVN